jgi:hypothetical protein
MLNSTSYRAEVVTIQFFHEMCIACTITNSSKEGEILIYDYPVFLY